MELLDIDMKKEFKTFTEDIKEALINIMTKPTVIREIEGGHLALMFNPDSYISIINDFMKKQELY